MVEPLFDIPKGLDLVIIASNAPKESGFPKVLCPFCLTLDYKYRFARTLKGGRKIARKGECPHCHHVLYETSLLKDGFDLEKYAHWVADYQGFFKLVDFTKWSNKLRAWDLATDFWQFYHDYKMQDPAYAERYLEQHPEKAQEIIDQQYAEYEQEMKERGLKPL